MAFGQNDKLTLSSLLEITLERPVADSGAARMNGIAARLTRIEEQLGAAARYAGRDAFVSLKR